VLTLMGVGRGNTVSYPKLGHSPSGHRAASGSSSGQRSTGKPENQQRRRPRAHTGIRIGTSLEDHALRHL